MPGNGDGWPHTQPEDTNTKQVLERSLRGKRRRGRPKKTWRNWNTGRGRPRRKVLEKGEEPNGEYC